MKNHLSSRRHGSLGCFCQIDPIAEMSSQLCCNSTLGSLKGFLADTKEMSSNGSARLHCVCDMTTNNNRSRYPIIISTTKRTEIRCLLHLHFFTTQCIVWWRREEAVDRSKEGLSIIEPFTDPQRFRIRAQSIVPLLITMMNFN